LNEKVSNLYLILFVIVIAYLKIISTFFLFIRSFKIGAYSEELPLGKISALRRAASFDPPGANKKEIENKKLYFLTC